MLAAVGSNVTNTNPLATSPMQPFTMEGGVIATTPCNRDERDAMLAHRQPARGDITVIESASKMRDRKLSEFQEWRRGCGVLWVSEVLRADGRTPRQRYTAALRAAGGADLARLRRILFGPGRVEVGPARRVGYSALEAWTAI